MLCLASFLLVLVVQRWVIAIGNGEFREVDRGMEEVVWDFYIERI